MGNKVDLVKEIYDRLYLRSQTGEVLASVKKIRVGSIESARKLNDYPLINIRLNGGEETFISQPTAKTDLMSVTVSLICPKEDGVSSLYDTTNSTGILFLLEAVLNVLDKLQSSTTVNLDMNGNARDYSKYSYSISEHQDLVQADIDIDTPTIQFITGNR